MCRAGWCSGDDRAMNTSHHLNQVELVGRVSAVLEPRTLPSGDEVVSFRLVVERPQHRRRTRQSVDTFDCDAWSATTRRSVGRLVAGSTVRVTGALRRRFVRGAAGVTSRVTIDVASVRKEASIPSTS